MASLKQFFAFLTLALFSVALAAPSTLVDNTASLNFTNVKADDYVVSIFGRGIFDKCADTTSIVNGLDTDVNDINVAIQELIGAIADKQKCGCTWDNSILDLFHSIHMLAITLAGNIVKINWICVQFSVLFHIGGIFVSLLTNILHLLLCTLSYVVITKIDLEESIWNIIFDIPIKIMNAIGVSVSGVAVLKLLVDALLENIKSAIRLLVPHCGCNVHM